MKVKTKYWKFSAALVFSLFLLPPVTQAQHYRQTNLVSNIVGMAPTTDPNLKNPWGLTRSAGSPWWIEIGRASCREKSVDLGGRRIIKKKKKTIKKSQPDRGHNR